MFALLIPSVVLKQVKLTKFSLTNTFNFIILKLDFRALSSSVDSSLDVCRLNMLF